METKVKEFFTKKRTCALLTVLVLILQMFSPYSVLMNKVYAAEPAAGEPYFELAIHPIDASGAYDDWDEDTSYYYYDYDPDTDTLETYSGTRVVLVDLVLKGSTTVNSAAISLKYDSTKMTPSMEVNVGTKKNPRYEMQDATDFADFLVDGTIWDVEAIATLDTSTSTFRLDGGSTTGDIAENTVIMTMVYKLADGVTLQDLTTDVFTLAPASGLTSGLQIPYVNSSGTTVSVEGDTYLLFDGFAAGTKKVDSIAIKTMPSKTQYYTGETLDYTGGEIKVTYDDTSEETISIPDAIANGTLTASSTVATSSKKVTFTYDGKTTDFEYYLLNSLSVGTQLSNMNYEHGDSINFAGGELIATYVNNSGATQASTLNIANELAAGTLSVDRNTADVDNKTITFTYYDNKTASMTLTVTDPIASISITTQPTTLTYSDGDTISLAGGIITPITKSGKTATTVATDAATVTASTTTASIAQATNKWTIAGGDGLEAGNQTITLTYEGKTADYTIVVNDTVASLSITTQPTTKNKLGTASAALSFSGIVATIQTSGGASFTVGESSLTIDRSSYNANSLSTQSFPVRYGTVNSSNNAEITLSNYITGISVNFTNTEFDYGTPLSTVLTSGTYTENYADGTSSSAKAISSSMVTGYNASPAAALFGADHTYAETLTIKLSSSSNPFDQLPATATQAITIKDVVDNITVLNKPSKISYNYGEAFSSNGGQINVNYKSGNTTTVSMGNSAVSLTETDGSTINMSPAISEFVNGKATKTIKVTYTDGTNTYDTSFDITIKDEVSSIAVTTDPTLTFEHGDTFNADGGKLTVTYASTRTEVIDLDMATLTETDDSTINMTPAASEYTNNSLTKTIKVTYGSKNTTYTITIKNTVSSISVTAPTTTTYNLNDSTSLAGGEVVVTRKAGNTENVALTDSKVTVTDFDTSVAGTNKTANVKYTEDGKDYTGTFTYTVIDNVTSIVITAPTDVNFNHGDTLTFNGGNIAVHYAGGSTNNITIDSTMVTDKATGTSVNMSPAASDYTNYELTKTLTITYTEGGVTKTQDYTITIKNNITGIAMGTVPTNTTYNINDAAYDLTGGDIIVTRAVGNAETVSLTDTGVTLTPLSTLTTSTGTKAVTVTYEGKTTTFNITVKNGVTNIAITAPTDVTFEHGDTLTLNGGTITVTYADGTTAPVTMTTAMVKETLSGTNVNMSPAVSEYDSNNQVTKNLTIEYTEDGVTKSETYNITINNSIDNIAIATSPRASYNLNESTTGVGGTLTVTRKAGNTESVNIEDSMVTNLDTTTAGVGKTATVTYQGKTTTYTYDVIDNVTSIDITAPTDITFNHGDTLTFNGGNIAVHYAGGSTNNITIDSTMVTDKATGTSVNMSPAASDYTNYELTKTLTITYTEGGVTKTQDYTITIKNNITGIAMGTVPTNTTYNINDAAYDLTGGDIIVTRAVGNAETVSLTDTGVTLTPLSTLTTSTGTKAVTVTYEGKTTTFNITVKNGVTNIAITAPTDVTFEHGDTLTLNGGTITVTYADGTTAPVTMTTAMVTETSSGSSVNMSPAVSEYNSSNQVTKNLTISYTEDGVTNSETYNITIKNTVSSISVTAPTTTTYNLNDTPSLTGGEVVVTRKAGNTENVALTDSKVTVTDFDTTTAGLNKTANVKYTEDGKDYTGTFTYTVIDNVTSIVITAPTDITFEHGDTLTLNGGTITVTYADGTTAPVTMTTAMVTETSSGSSVNMSPAVSEYDSNNQVIKNLTITYTEDGVTNSATYDITINNSVDNIAIATSPKTSYKLNEATTGVGGTLTVTRKAGNTETVNIEDSMVTGLDTTIVGTGKTATVTYQGKTTTYTYDVTDNVASISIVGTPKTDYKLNETLEPLQIEVTKESGNTEIVTVTESMVSGYDSTTEGTQTVTITYAGKTTSYTVNVKDAVQSITMGTTPKTNYLVGETLDVTGGTIIVTKESGNTESLNITPGMVSGFNSTSEQLGQVLTVTHEGKTTTYTVNITDSVSNITLNPGPSKTTYKYGESLDLTGAYIDIVKENGTTDRKAVTSSMVSGFNSTPAQGTLPSTQTVTVTYGKDTSGNDVTTTFTVTVEDYITKITVNGAKTEYNYNEALDLSIGTLDITMASGTPTTPVNLNASNVTVTGFTATTVSVQTLTVTYEGMTTTYDVNVKDYVTSTSIVVPTKVTYNYGDSLDLSTGKIVQTWASGAADTELPLQDSMVTKADGTPVNMTPSSFGTDNKVQETLKITHEGITEDYTIEIINDIKSIVIKETPKTEYNYGDSIDTSIGSIEVTRANGDKEEIPLSDSRITIVGFDTSTPINNVPVTVEFTENGVTKQTNYSINVKDDVTSIQLVGTPKTNYKYGESLDLTGLTLTVTRPSGVTPNVPVTMSMISGYDPTVLNNQTVTITYGGKTETFTVNVEDYLKDIELVKPSKVNYKLNESLDLTGASITEVMASGAKVTGIAVTSSMVSFLDSSTEGTKTLTVTYVKEGNTFTKQFKVIVADDLAGITVKNFPVDEYLYGEKLDLTGATIEVETESGDKQELPITKDMVSGYVEKPASSNFATSDEYIQVITISYTKDGITKKTSYPITTKDYFDKIKVEGLEKDYTWGEDLKLDNATVAKVSASGIVSDKVQLTKDMISGYNSKKEGEQTLTVSYAGKTTNPVVKVTDNVLAISINSEPNKKTYNYGTSLNLDGAKLNVVKNSGTSVIDITKDMVSGYNARKSGVQTLTVTYAGLKAEFSVTVKAKPIVIAEPETPNTPTVEEPTNEAVEEPTVQEPIAQEPTDSKPIQKPVEKPEENKEEQKKEVDPILVGASMLAGLSMLFLIILILTKKNVEIYIEEEEDIKLIGKDNLSDEDNQELDLTKYMEKYPNDILQVVFTKSLAKKLDGKTVTFKLANNEEKKVVVKYEKEEFITTIETEKPIGKDNKQKIIKK